jgi:copper resistance protein B
MPGMDHGGMAGMHSGSMADSNKSTGMAMPAAESATMPSMHHPAMSGMAPAAPKGGDHATMPANNHASVSGMNMGTMQGGSAPPDARSPDYSDGVGYGPMKPHMHGKTALGMLLLDQLETFHGRAGNGQAWEVQGWYGRDEDKLWLRSEGEVSKGKVEDGNLEALWDHAIATYWDSQLGVRHDFGAGPGRDWVAFGVQGLAPCWFALEATGYVGSSGRTAARFRADYEVLFTQRLILQPELEINLYGKDDPARGIGSGLSDAQFGLRLRYEIRRQFAPYVGINWVRRVGAAAGYARQGGAPVLDRQWVAGVRIWL